jgi:ABC-type sugar transport system ATPase subunit
MSQPILQLKAINKSFGPVHVLHNVDLTVEKGKVTALVGDNGAGKSTLIKCIAGIYTPESGEFIFEGNNVEIDGPRAATSLGIEVVYQIWPSATTSTSFTTCFLVARRSAIKFSMSMKWNRWQERHWMD